MATNDKKIEGQVVLTDDLSKSVAKIINERKSAFIEHRRQIALEIKANICYLIGKQDIGLVGGHIQELPKERQIESTANIILPAVQKDIAVATAVPPTMDIVPAGTDDDDKATAIAGQKIHNYHKRKLGHDFKRAECVLWYDIAGIGWRKTYWNPNDAVIAVNPEAVDENGQPNPAHIPELPVGEPIMEGEVAIDNVPAHLLIYDYRIGDVKKLPWIIQCDRVPASWVVDRFNQEVYNKLQNKFSTTTSKETQFEMSAMNSLIGTVGTGSVDQQTLVTSKMQTSSEMRLKSDEMIDYYEYWAKPTKQNPAGNLAFMLDDQLVEHNPFPKDAYPHGELPYTPAAPLPIEKATNGSVPRISQARPLQREYNRLRSQIAENNDIMGNAVIMAPRQAKLRYSRLSNGAGNIIEYDGPVGKPTRETGVPMNSQIFVYMEETKRAIEDIFAFHGPSRGLAPKNIESGKGLQQLENADIKHLGPIVSTFEQADERIIFQALTIALANYPPGKLINVVGSDYEWTTYEIDPEQLKGKLNVIVRPKSSMPLDKEQERIQIFQTWQSGLLGDPMDPELRVWVMDQMHVGNNEALLQKHSKQKNFAKKEFAVAYANMKTINIPDGLSEEQMAMEIEKYTFVPPINAFDDHMVHIACHGEWMMDNFWELRATGNPIVFEFLRKTQEHMNLHGAIIADTQAREFQKQLMAQMLIKGKTMDQIALSKMDLSGKSKNKDKKD